MITDGNENGNYWEKNFFLQVFFTPFIVTKKYLFFGEKKFLLLFCYFCSKNGNFLNLKIKNYLEIKIFFIYNIKKMNQNLNNLNHKNNSFICMACEYITNRKSNYQKHNYKKTHFERSKIAKKSKSQKNR